jgi:hypothetical protein
MKLDEPTALTIFHILDSFGIVPSVSGIISESTKPKEYSTGKMAIAVQLIEFKI